MKLEKITSWSYLDVLKLAKELLNHDYFLTKENIDLVNVLGDYVSAHILSKATHGYFILDAEDQKIGILLFKIPNKERLYNEYNSTIDLSGWELKKYLWKNILQPIESQLIKFEIDTLKNSMELYNDCKMLTQNKAEILLLYIREDYRGKGISKSLFGAFFEDLQRNNMKYFYLYTTSFFNTGFYDFLKLQRLEKTIYDESNCPSFLKLKLKLPYTGYIYLGNIREIEL